MTFFDVKNLFTNVPLDKTIDFILKKVYNEKKIQINIFKRVYIFATDSCIFFFQKNIQCDGVAMSSPLRLLIAKSS